MECFFSANIIKQIFIQLLYERTKKKKEEIRFEKERIFNKVNELSELYG